MKHSEPNEGTTEQTTVDYTIGAQLLESKKNSIFICLLNGYDIFLVILQF